ncbi:MAG: hypothetical protein AAFY98_07310 [Verrucomicrobiota bacterium]
MKKFPHFVLMTICLLALGTSLRAQSGTLDWDSVTWDETWTTGFFFVTNSNPLSETYNINGVNVTVEVSRNDPTTSGGSSGLFASTTDGEVANRTSTPNNAATPITNSGGEAGLYVDVNYDSRVDTNTATYGDTSADFIQYTISFDTAVTEVSFDLWDLDLGNSGGSTYQDVVLFDPNGPDYTLVNRDSSDPDVEIYTTGDGTEGLRGVGTTANQAVGTITTNPGNGNDTFNSGDVGVSFSNSDNSSFTSVSFRYFSGDGDGSVVSIPADPTLQRISLHDVFFAVPEPSTWVGAAVLLTIGSVTVFRRRVLRLKQE